MSSIPRRTVQPFSNVFTAPETGISSPSRSRPRGSQRGDLNDYVEHQRRLEDSILIAGLPNSGKAVLMKQLRESFKSEQPNNEDTIASEQLKQQRTLAIKIKLANNSDCSHLPSALLSLISEYSYDDKPYSLAGTSSDIVYEGTEFHFFYMPTASPGKLHKYFQTLSGIAGFIFVVNLEDYDRISVNDKTGQFQNSLLASMDLFDEYCRIPLYQFDHCYRLCILLFTNRQEFKTKIQEGQTMPTEYFPDYNGDITDEESVMSYIRLSFHQRHSKYEPKVSPKKSSASPQFNFSSSTNDPTANRGSLTGSTATTVGTNNNSQSTNQSAVSNGPPSDISRLYILEFDSVEDESVKKVLGTLKEFLLSKTLHVSQIEEYQKSQLSDQAIDAFNAQQMGLDQPQVISCFSCHCGSAVED
jgi:hypothetical protein